MSTSRTFRILEEEFGIRYDFIMNMGFTRSYNSVFSAENVRANV